MTNITKMRVVYLAEWDAYRESGVLNKITSQIRTWRTLGVDCSLVIISPVEDNVSNPFSETEEIVLVSYTKGNILTSKINKGVAFEKAKEVLASLKPDVIYYRESSWSPGLISALKISRISVFEINTGNGELWAARAGRIGTVVLGILSREWLRRKAGGYICVTSEIAKEFRKYRAPVEVVTNGFDLASHIHVDQPRNHRPSLVLVASGSQLWQGVDKLINLAKALPEFDFNLVGPSISGPENLRCHGRLSQLELKTLYGQMDVGVGTLALHRKGLNEACPLKVREYLAHGLPVIGAYYDPDCAGSNFFLELPNRETFDQSDLSAIRSFISQWHGRRVDPNEVALRIDAITKERQRLEILFNMVCKHSSIRYSRS